MNKRKKLLALMGALVLTVGTVGVALAEDLKESHTGIWIGWDENGDPLILDTDNEDADVTDELLDDGETCAELELGEGEIEIHFVLSPTSADAGNLTVNFDPDPDYGPAAADGNQGSQLDWDVPVTGPVTVVSASTDVDGNNAEQDELKISHICVGDEPGDEPTPTPEFTDEEEGDTDAPSEPNTATIGGNGTSGPADGAWLLVVALGVLLASVVVMTPARAKSRR